MTNELTHKQFFNSPAVKQKFSEVVNGNGQQFVASLLSIVTNNNLLAKATNESIMTAAMKAAVLNLPIEPSLGYAYIVPYKNQAQFQVGYKGLIQLAQRSGQVTRLNAGEVYESQYKGFNPLTEDLEVDMTAIPKENEKDLEEIPANAKAALSIYPVETIDEVLAIALENPPLGIEIVPSKAVKVKKTTRAKAIQ